MAFESSTATFANSPRGSDGEPKPRKLSETLRLPLALNRLYMGYPVKWLTDVDQEACARPNPRRRFHVQRGMPSSEPIRPSHASAPRRCAASARVMTPRAHCRGPTDLAAVFARAAGESDGKIVVRLLRVFGACSPVPLLFERIRSVRSSITWHRVPPRHGMRPGSSKG